MTDIRTNGHAATKDTATALLERKLKLMENLSCRDLFAELEQVDQAMAELFGKIAQGEAALQMAKAAVEEAAVLATISVEGKNETERKNNKAIALREDPAYQNALMEQHGAEGALVALNADMEAAKRQGRRVERKIDYYTGVLNFLAG